MHRHADGVTDWRRADVDTNVSGEPEPRPNWHSLADTESVVFLHRAAGERKPKCISQSIVRADS